MADTQTTYEDLFRSRLEALIAAALDAERPAAARRSSAVRAHLTKVAKGIVDTAIGAAAKDAKAAGIDSPATERRRLVRERNKALRRIDDLEDTLERGQAPTQEFDGSDRMPNNLRNWLEGMSVSVDVSTGEHDMEHRYFGLISEVMDDECDKHRVTLLVQNPVANFDRATGALLPPPVFRPRKTRSRTARKGARA